LSPLSLLQRQGVITAKHDRLIAPGADWTQVLDHFLNEADIILLLISSDFLASDYCYGREMQTALKRHQDHEARVIPILLRPVDWQSAPFHALQALPTNGKPVTSWSNRDAAFADIAAGIRQAIKERSPDPITGSALGASPLWNIPFPRNLFFTGQDNLFADLERVLQMDQSAALSQPQAMSGLGGVGKTQLAVEYAYRHAQDYEAVLWIPAANQETLLSGFASLADLLHLPERHESDQQKRVEAVKRWLRQQSHWLLILDNADDLSLLPDFLPSGRLKGHTLLTTRAYALGGLANRIEVDTLDQATGTLLLLHRAGLLPLEMPLEQAREEDRLDGQQIWHELGGLPLALDQAGAYIEETQCGLSSYLHLFRTHRSILLKQRGGVLRDHPDSVYTTFTLAVKAVIQRHSAAKDLLWVCALMHPDAIPEEIFLQGTGHLGSTLGVTCTEMQDWNALLGTVSAYSLLKRQPRAQTFSIHRLMQAVLQEHISEQERVQWTHRLTIALNHVFSLSKRGTKYTRLIPHILNIEEYTHSWKNAPLELASLLDHTAGHLSWRAQFKQAESLYQRALQIREQALALEHPDVANSLNGLASLYSAQGEYEQAEQLSKRALYIQEQALGPNHPDVVSSLEALADLYSYQGKDEQAKLLYQRALHITEQAQGSDHPDVAILLDELARFYIGEEQAELYQRAIHIFEGQEPGGMFTSLVNLGVHYHRQGKNEQAEALYLRALHIWEKSTDSIDGTIVHSNLSNIYCEQGEHEQAEQFARRALSICEQNAGLDHPNMAIPLTALAELHQKQRHYQQSELLYQQALSICESALGEKHWRVMSLLEELASLYQEQEKYGQAESLYRRVLRNGEQVLGREHPKTVKRQMLYDEFLQTMRNAVQTELTLPEKARTDEK
jgi:tetratricopeptide (TPR) repeat protein